MHLVGTEGRPVVLIGDVTRIMTLRPFAILAAAALLVAGCAATLDEPEAGLTPEASVTPDAQPTEDRCLTVDQSTIDSMSQGLNVEAHLTGWAAVKSNDYENVGFVSALATGGALENDAVTFATNDDPTQPGIEGLTLAADGFTNEFTDCPYGPYTSFGVIYLDDGGEESRACAEAAAG